MNLEQTEERYQNDVMFHNLVNLLYGFFHGKQFNYNDAMDAAFLAVLKAKQARDRYEITCNVA